ncbi:MAG TPA: RNA polymerase sigma factor [Polyangia bacterium]|jgi:RNA polymerase sigma-70 factor (ECF subfamily)|nr:RNA polymerase sigma factor [Polyangia bacterium]
MAAADSSLVVRLRRGERTAFRDLYARFAQASFGYLLRLAGRRDAAEDLHQEAWLSIAQHAARLTPETDLAAWIFTVARNRFLSSRRRADAAVSAADPAVLAGGASGVRPADDPGCRDLERALASLPEAHRDILLLVGVEGLEIAQAAEVLAIRVDAARQRLARARAALTEALGGDDAAGAAPEPIATSVTNVSGKASS